MTHANQKNEFGIISKCLNFLIWGSGIPCLSVENVSIFYFFFLLTAEIVMFDGQIVVYKFIQDLHFFVTGGEEDNELILASVLQGFSDAVDLLLRLWSLLKLIFSTSMHSFAYLYASVHCMWTRFEPFCFQEHCWQKDSTREFGSDPIVYRWNCWWRVSPTFLLDTKACSFFYKFFFLNLIRNQRSHNLAHPSRPVHGNLVFKSGPYWVVTKYVTVRT